MNIFIQVLCFFLLLSTTLAGEVDIKKLPSLLGGSNAGGEFYFSFPTCYDEESPGGDNSIRVFVASGVRQEVVLEVKGQGYRVSKVTVPNDVIEFLIPTTVGQPYLKRRNELAPPERVYKEAAVHINSSAPIIVYGMTKYQYTSDGFLAIPVHSLGTEYVVASYPQFTAAVSTYELPSMSNIIAPYDDTEVTFTMGGTPNSRTTGGLKKGQKATFSMMKGDVVCLASAVAPTSYTEAIVFSSDARTRDSIGELKGRGIEGGLLARGADWGRKRIGNGPYVDSKGIILENIGNGPIRILSSSSPDADFAFDKNVFNGMTLQPNQVIEVEAAFSPTVIGNDNLVVTFETDLGFTIPTDPPLRGAGIIGQLQTQDYNFDSTIVQGVVKPANRKMVRVTNIGTLDGAGADFSDDVTITDLVAVTAGSISETNSSYGTEGFKYNKAALGLPLILKKGEYLEFQAEFQAQKFGLAVAEVQIESDASNPAIITKWTGFGIDPFRPDPQIEPKGGSVNNICVGSSGDITATIKNIGNVKFPVLNVFINPETNTEFSIDTVSMKRLLASHLDLDETRNVKIAFSPVGASGSRTVKMGIVGPTVDDTVYVDVTGVAVAYVAQLVVAGDSTIVHGTKTSIRIGLQSAPNAAASLQSLPMTIHYDPRIFSPKLEEIELAGVYALGNYSIENIRFIKDGEIGLTIEAVGSTSLIDKAGDILTVPMNVSVISDSSFTTEIEAKGFNQGCLSIIPGKASFIIDRTEQEGISPISFIQKGNELEITILNPTQSQTTLQFYNLKGQLIREDDLGYFLNKTITLSAGNFTPGVYLIRMNAEYYSFSRPILISE